ncbi:hypothetical protein BC941DRAFT_451785 [Chlamydoabsidia padenii]|nr:hypothetical protein BC941DRAFT_451785 [Chlamydoabsidia padenii]
MYGFLETATCTNITPLVTIQYHPHYGYTQQQKSHYTPQTDDTASLRLPAMESKMASCEQVLTVLGRMRDITRLFDQHHLDQHDITTEALYLLNKLDHILDHINHTFGGTSLASPAVNGAQQQISKRLSEQQTHPRPKSTILKDPLNIWSNRLSKSVDRIRIEIKPLFVMRDFDILMNKWLKRSHQWLLEE